MEFSIFYIAERYLEQMDIFNIKITSSIVLPDILNFPYHTLRANNHTPPKMKRKANQPSTKFKKYFSKIFNYIFQLSPGSYSLHYTFF